MADMKADELGVSVARDPSMVTHAVPTKEWMDIEAVFKPGNYCYPGKTAIVDYLGKAVPGVFGPAREWNVESDDWKLPDNWKEIVINGFKERLDKFRSLKIFMDCCVRCGACADKCQFFLGTGDPKNMPVMRAELMRSVYRNEFTKAGKILGRIAGARPMTFKVLKEWFMYFYQCTECRRCSVFCPYGIDTAEITILAREVLHLLSVNTNWILEPVANSNRTGNHMGLQPHTLKENVEYICEDIEEITGVKITPSWNRKGAEILFITPSADFFAEPGTFTCMGYLLLFEHLGLDYTLSTYASEGGNFGMFSSNELLKKLNGKMYAEAERLGVKWILGGECGHMWRVVNQYMSTMTGPADFLEVPKSPITGTVFENAATTKMTHISEFTADLIRHGKLKLDPSRNDHRAVTYHDPCNIARGMGLLEEPRYVLKHVVNKFHEMPENTIREKTFCCGSGAGLHTGEIMELRMRAGLPRANAVQYVHDKHQVNTLSTMCAIDRATLTVLMDYWVPGVEVTGVSELVGNALIMDGEKEVRETGLRFEALAGSEGDANV
ncbi:Sulfite reduction-associated complex DsrMKJOP protein DsrK (=HmeD) [hydrothermal vent metagenome]|uniref:Sulfite reduction-associated complex DsrMKJOP protein DsrK (=HmeD) n=1 Tax=hydrothermal vent metagenome TaxID=652676 RepID=A0A3B0VAN7_9ZZZZ